MSPKNWEFTEEARRNGGRRKHENRKNKKVASFIGTANIGSDYTEDEKEWLKAVMTFQQKHRRYPTLEEAFAIALALGYRKAEEGV